MTGHAREVFSGSFSEVYGIRSPFIGYLMRSFSSIEPRGENDLPFAERPEGKCGTVGKKAARINRVAAGSRFRRNQWVARSDSLRGE